MSGGRVTAVVLNWCNEHDTKACMDSLAAQDYAWLSVQLVDNASPDGSGGRLHVRYPDAAYLQTERNYGYSGGNNRGIKLAVDSGAEYVLVVNNDTVLESSCVTQLVTAVRGAETAAVGPKILRYDSPDTIWFGGGTFDRMRAMGQHAGENLPDVNPDESETREVSFLTGCCMLIPAAALRTVGVFREDFFAYCEDVEWSLRAAEKGMKLVYAPAARIRHRVPAFGALPSAMQIRYRDRNRRRIVRLHYSAGEAALFALWFYPTRIALLVRYALMGEMERVRAVWKGMTEA